MSKRSVQPKQASAGNSPNYIVKLLGQVLGKMHSVAAVIHVNSRKKVQK